MDYVLIERLKKSIGYDETIWFQWNPGKPILLSDIEAAIVTGMGETVIPFGDEWNYPVKEKDNDYHLARIIYYVNHPEEIDGISVDNETSMNYIMPNAKIIDGNHRFAAALYLNKEKIGINYGGRLDILEYLTGESDVDPQDIE